MAIILIIPFGIITAVFYFIQRSLCRKSVRKVIKLIPMYITLLLLVLSLILIILENSNDVQGGIGGYNIIAVPLVIGTIAASFGVTIAWVSHKRKSY
jgi:ACR3 family arsenite efflux pump ArsB